MKPVRDTAGRHLPARIAATTLPQRFTPPAVEMELERTALAGGLHEEAGRSVILLESPAGDGKTAFLAQWRKASLSNQQQVAWATMQTAQRTAAGLLQTVVDAFHAIGVDQLPELPHESIAQSAVTREHYVESLMA